MTEMQVLRTEAAAARAAAAKRGALPLGVPDPGAPRSQKIPEGTELRASKVTKDGQEWVKLEGYASVFETPYDMWDEYGPYTEVVSKGAANRTLAQNPFVIFRWNHGGTAMANTRNGRLELSTDDIGLKQRALVNPTRDDVKLLLQAIEDDDVSEQSFMFSITEGRWSPDMTEYRIEEFDLDRGDVGPVQYGANPYTSIAARSGEILADLRRLPRLAAREALQILSARDDVAADEQPVETAPEPETRSVEDAAAAIGEPAPEPKLLPPIGPVKRETMSVAYLAAMLHADDE